MTRISDKLRQQLYEEFETTDLLQAVKELDSARRALSDLEDENGIRPPQVRIDILELHNFAHRIINEGHTTENDNRLWELCHEIEDEIYPIMENMQSILDTVNKLQEFQPDPFDDDDEEEEEEKESL